MTTHAMTECKHCGIRYGYQMSGHGCHDEKNDDRYCPVCMEAILEALANVPKKFEYKYVECDDFTREEAISEVDLYDKGRMFKRVFPGLYDPTTKEHSRDRYFKKNEEEYYIHYWEMNNNDWYLKKKVRWDIQNDCISEK